MRWILVGLAKGAVAVLVVVALGAGIYEVAPTRAAECPISPPEALGACSSHAQCQDMCEEVWDPIPVEGFCGPPGGEMCCGCFAI